MKEKTRIKGLKKNSTKHVNINCYRSSNSIHFNEIEKIVKYLKNNVKNENKKYILMKKIIWKSENQKMKYQSIKKRYLKRLKELIIFLIQFNNLLRISDVLKLKVDDVLNEKWNIKDSFYAKDKKTKKLNVIMLTNEMKNFLKEIIKIEWLKRKDYLFHFQNDTTKHMKNKVFNRFMKKLKKKFNLMWNISTHSIRKSWAIYLLENWVMLSDIMIRLNHSSISKTLIYLERTEIEFKEKFFKHFI